MNKTRLRFSKIGRAKYISHLDLMRTMRRAFLRAGIELRYSEGFNPHPYISAALPLSVGCESVCELLDFQPADGVPVGLPELLDKQLPEGIVITNAYEPETKFTGISCLEVQGVLIYDDGIPTGFEDKTEETFHSADTLTINKKTKSGMSEIDVKPYIKGFELSRVDDNQTVISARLSAREPTITTGDLLNAVCLCGGALKPDFASFRRIEVYDSNNNIFR